MKTQKMLLFIFLASMVSAKCLTSHAVRAINFIELNPKLLDLTKQPHSYIECENADFSMTITVKFVGKTCRFSLNADYNDNIKIKDFELDNICQQNDFAASSNLNPVTLSPEFQSETNVQESDLWHNCSDRAAELLSSAATAFFGFKEPAIDSCTMNDESLEFAALVRNAFGNCMMRASFSPGEGVTLSEGISHGGCVALAEKEAPQTAADQSDEHRRKQNQLNDFKQTFLGYLNKKVASFINDFANAKTAAQAGEKQEAQDFYQVAGPGYNRPALSQHEQPANLGRFIADQAEWTQFKYAMNQQILEANQRLQNNGRPPTGPSIYQHAQVQAHYRPPAQKLSTFANQII